MEFLDLDEEVGGRTDLRSGARQAADRIDQVGWGVGGPAVAAVVSGLVRLAAVGTGSADEAVGEEALLLGIEQLFDVSLHDEVGLTQRPPDLVAILSALLAVGAAIVVEFDAEATEVGEVFLLDLGDEVFFGPILVLSAQGDRRAVGVVSTDIDAAVASEFLVADPDVGLEVFDQVTEVNGPIGIGKGGGDEELAHGGKGERRKEERGDEWKSGRSRKGTKGHRKGGKVSLRRDREVGGFPGSAHSLPCREDHHRN